MYVLGTMDNVKEKEKKSIGGPSATIDLTGQGNEAKPTNSSHDRTTRSDANIVLLRAPGSHVPEVERVVTHAKISSTGRLQILSRASSHPEPFLARASETFRLLPPPLSLP